MRREFATISDEEETFVIFFAVALRGRSPSSSSGRGGFRPPSYHVNFTGGMSPRAGKIVVDDGRERVGFFVALAGAGFDTCGRFQLQDAKKWCRNCRSPCHPERHNRNRSNRAKQKANRPG